MSTVINKTIKILAVATAITLVGCAGQPRQQYRPVDMTTFVPNCKDARFQTEYLTQKINEYLEYHQNNPPTLEDRRNYGKMKNTLWSLRSSCSAKYL